MNNREFSYKDMGGGGGQGGGRGGGGRGGGQGGGQGGGRGGGQGMGRGGGRALGPGGKCVCPSCGATVDHKQGQPCYEVNCPKCGQKMSRR